MGSCSRAFLAVALVALLALGQAVRTQPPCQKSRAGPKSDLFSGSGGDRDERQRAIELIEDQLKKCNTDKYSKDNVYKAAKKLSKSSFTEELHDYAFDAIWLGYVACFEKGNGGFRRPRDVILENLKEYGKEATDFLEEKVVQVAAAKLGGSDDTDLKFAEELLGEVDVHHIDDGAGNVPALSSFDLALSGPLQFEWPGFSHRVEALLRLARQKGGFQKAAPPLLRLLGDPEGDPDAAGAALDEIQSVTLSSVHDEAAALPQPDYLQALEKLSVALNECGYKKTCGLVAAAIAGLSNIGVEIEQAAAHYLALAVIWGSTEGAHAAVKMISSVRGGIDILNEIVQDEGESLDGRVRAAIGLGELKMGSSSIFGSKKKEEDPMFAAAVGILMKAVQDDGGSLYVRVMAADGLGKLRSKGAKLRKRKAQLRVFAERADTPDDLKQALKATYEKKGLSGAVSNWLGKLTQG